MRTDRKLQALLTPLRERAPAEEIVVLRCGTVRRWSVSGAAHQAYSRGCEAPTGPHRCLGRVVHARRLIQIQDADDFCRAQVADCDVFVGILGHLYGSCPQGSEQSYTEREYDAAVAATKPCLMFF